MEFLVDGEVVATHPSTDAAGTYSVTWDSTTVGDGVHLVEAKAHDSSGNTASSLRTVTVDNTAPTVRATSPAADAKKIPLTLSATGITAVFSERMDEGTLDEDAVKLESIVKKGKIVPVALGEVSLGQEDGRTLTIKPSAPGFAKKGTYRVTVAVGAKDQAGNALARQESWEFAMAKKK